MRLVRHLPTEPVAATPSRLAHIAESREQARQNVAFGLDHWAQYFREIATFPIVPPEIDNAYEYLTENRLAVRFVGAAQAAVNAEIEKLKKKEAGSEAPKPPAPSKSRSM